MLPPTPPPPPRPSAPLSSLLSKTIFLSCSLSVLRITYLSLYFSLPLPGRKHRSSAIPSLAYSRPAPGRSFSSPHLFPQLTPFSRNFNPTSTATLPMHPPFSTKPPPSPFSSWLNISPLLPIRLLCPSSAPPLLAQSRAGTRGSVCRPSRLTGRRLCHGRGEGCRGEVGVGVRGGVEGT